MKKFAQGFPANGSVWGQAEYFGGLRAESNDVGARVPAPVTQMPGGEGQLQAFGSFENAFLGVLAEGDVIDHADETVRLASLIEQERDGGEGPDNRTVFADVTLLVIVFLDLAREQLADVFVGLWLIRGKSEVHKSELEHLFAGITNDLGEAIVDLLEAAVERSDRPCRPRPG